VLRWHLTLTPQFPQLADPVVCSLQPAWNTLGGVMKRLEKPPELLC
jgi:hypothetical protein